MEKDAPPSLFRHYFPDTNLPDTIRSSTRQIHALSNAVPPLSSLSIPADLFRISDFTIRILLLRPSWKIVRQFRFDSPAPAAETPRPFAMRHTISVLVENKFGVLTRIAGMFSGRGFNIDSLNVGPTLDPATSRMTIVVKGDDNTLEQVTKQLNKLIDVIRIEDFRDEEIVERELVLMRVTVNSETRAEVMQIGDIFRAKIIDVQINNLAIEITGNESKLDKFLLLMGKFGITELTRTGRIALARKSH